MDDALWSPGKKYSLLKISRVKNNKYKYTDHSVFYLGNISSVLIQVTMDRNRRCEVRLFIIVI